MLECTEIHSYVRELEKMISRMEGVSDVVVISIDQPSGEQVFKAFVEPEDDKQINTQSILKLCVDNSKGCKAPVSVTVCKIPRTPSGKVARQLLLEQCAG